ncbi:MAG TPA: hypothetical protein VMA53_10170 [Stellaceae bacterium]|nr:hypothetical protein [Stellaceae bacterium]
MGIFRASIIIGPLMLIGALPAAGQSMPPLGSGTPIRLAADDSSTSDRDSFTQKAQAEMQDWQQKLHDFGQQAEAKGQEAGSAAQSGLNDAWVKAKAASHKLKTVGAEGWQGAKASYEKASHNLAEAWQKVHPDDK